MSLLGPQGGSALNPWCESGKEPHWRGWGGGREGDVWQGHEAPSAQGADEKAVQVKIVASREGTKEWEKKPQGI